MLIKMFRAMALLFLIFLPTQAFWWRTSPTEAPPSEPPPVVMKQIPLTYFRTYTYQQPLTSNAIQLPFLGSDDYVSQYNSPYFNPMMPLLPMGLSAGNEIPLDTRPSKSYAKFNMIRSFGPRTAEAMTTSEPSTSTSSTTTTTTTTTTTPEPTTTTSTTSTTEAPSTLPIETTFPSFNRKAFTNHFNINYNRPVYPYPEYSLNEKSSAASNIEFVPCMCPVSVPKAGFPTRFQTGLPIAGNPSNSLFLAQGRTDSEAEDSLSAEAKAAEENFDLSDDMETVHMNVDEEAATSAQNRIV